MNRSNTSIAAAASSTVIDSAGLWLTPPAQRTKSIATGSRVESDTASWPAPLTSRRTG
jgi:hypothetical protein